MKYAKLGSLTFLLANADAGLRGPLKAKEATALALMRGDVVLPKVDLSPKFELPGVNVNDLNAGDQDTNEFTLQSLQSKLEKRKTPREAEAPKWEKLDEHELAYDEDGKYDGFYDGTNGTYHNIRDEHYRFNDRGVYEIDSPAAGDPALPRARQYNLEYRKQYPNDGRNVRQDNTNEYENNLELDPNDLDSSKDMDFNKLVPKLTRKKLADQKLKSNLAKGGKGTLGGMFIGGTFAGAAVATSHDSKSDSSEKKEPSKGTTQS